MEDNSPTMRAARDAGPHSPFRHPGQHVCSGAVCERLQARVRDLEVENEKLRRLALTDELTGTYNRRYFHDRLRTVLVERPRSGALALCLFDIDNFKDINDAHGHYAGDGVLRAVSLVAQDKLQRTDDCLCRLGGDEFAAIYTALSPSQAVEHAQQILDGIRLLKLPPAGAGARPGIVTASFGVVWLDAYSALDCDQVYAAADQALYRAKQAGRNQIGIAHLQ